MYIDKILNPGLVPTGRRNSRVFVRVIMTDTGKLSLTGVVGPTENGDAVGGCGQILDTLLDADFKRSEGWTPHMVDKLYRVWDEWHLNDMRAGSPRQREFLKAHPEFKDYSSTREALASVGLLVDREFWVPFGGKQAVGSVPPMVTEMYDSLYVPAVDALYSAITRANAKRDAYNAAAQTFVKSMYGCNSVQKTAFLRDVLGVVKQHLGESSVFARAYTRSIQTKLEESFSGKQPLTLHNLENACKAIVPLNKIPDVSLRALARDPANVLDELRAFLKAPLTTALSDAAKSALVVDFQRVVNRIDTGGQHDFLIANRPYEYGTGWLFESVPDDVVEWLDSLPVSKFTPAWI